jgi:hypothetical protein
MARDLCVVSCFFNPCGYRSLDENAALFARTIRASGASFLLVECAVGDQAHRLPDGADTIRVRAEVPLWQKERLFNIAIARAPTHCTKIAWVDADVLFERPDWMIAASDLLEDHAVVQLFEHAIRLPQGVHEFAGRGDFVQGFGSVYSSDPDMPFLGCYPLHGHTGYGWAARREALPLGLYDACLSGSADHLMAHVFAGDLASRCITRTLGDHGPALEHFLQWAEVVHSTVSRSLSCVRGTLLHLWHGELRNRDYTRRDRAVRAMGFNPSADIRLNPSGCWQLAPSCVRLREWSSQYFWDRRDDGGVDARKFSQSGPLVSLGAPCTGHSSG